MKNVLVAVLSLALAASPAAAEMVLEIIPLQNRFVNDMVPTLSQLVADGGTVTGANGQLVIRTTPENLVDLKRVIDKLDAQLKQLRISVRQDVNAHAQLREDEFSARVHGGEIDAGVGRPGNVGPGASIGFDDGDTSARYRNFSTREVQDSKGTHFVTTVEGQPAFINAGQSVPIPQHSSVLTPFGAVVHEGVYYRDVGAGFYVVPRLAGDRVNLEISPYRENLSRFGGGVIDSRGLATTVAGALGEWIPLGGAAEDFNDSQHGILHKTRRQGSDIYDVWVKVEVVP